MLSRGLHDAMTLWPAVFWPLVFSSCFYAYLRLCQMLRERHGFSPIGGRRRLDRVVTYGIVPAALAFEIAVHSYMVYVVGSIYLLAAIPIYIFGWVLLPALLDGFRPALTLLVLCHATFVAAFAVLLGFADINVLRALNSDLFGLLVGIPAKM